MQICIGEGNLGLQTPGDILKERIIITSDLNIVPVMPTAIVTDLGRIM
jgi:hypothetical protein